MSQFPQTLELAIEQAKSATTSALEAGVGRIQVDILVPEIALQAQAIAYQFLPLFERYGSGLKILFPDTGAAALARRDWGENLTGHVSDLGSRRTPVERKIASEDEIFLVVSPTAVEVPQVEKLCELAGDRPVVLLLPQLEDISIVGMGLTARQLRGRLLSTLESSYYFRPLEGAGILRMFPGPWQVWREQDGTYELLAEERVKPTSDGLELLLKRGQQAEVETDVNEPPAKGLLGGLQQLLRTLGQ